MQQAAHQTDVHTPASETDADALGRELHTIEQNSS